MSVRYRWVQWNRHKVVYDACVAIGILLLLGTFVGVGLASFTPPAEVSPPILVMRGLGVTGVVLLHIILTIGPLVRLDGRFAPLLYNRRHLGVAFFIVVLLHALVAIGFYGGFGRGVWLINVVSGGYRPGSGVPFELLGFCALLIFFVMAATSHDFWLQLLGSRVWKRLHMLAYLAYGLTVSHVALGSVQDRVDPAMTWVLIAGVCWLTGIHVAAGLVQLQRDRSASRDGAVADDGWFDAAAVADVPLNRAMGVSTPNGSEVAIFRHERGLSAVSGVCSHQGGPLAEGEVIDGCLTCPWHGYQYRPEDGCSPPPYTEKLATFDLRVKGDRIEIRVEPNPPGTRVEPAMPADTPGATPKDER